MKTWFGRAVILSLATVLCVACAPTPVVPSGQSRVPVNSDEGISQYRERVNVERRDRVERTGLVRHIEALTQQMQALQASVTLLERQQQEAEKGPGRQVQQVGAVSPPLLSRAADNVRAKNKETTRAQANPLIAAVPHEIARQPMIPIAEGPTDRCGHWIGDPSAYGWIDPTSEYLSQKTGLRAEHGRCRHMASSQEDSR